MAFLFGGGNPGCLKLLNWNIPRKAHPGKRPKQCGGGGIIYDHADADDDDDDGDYDLEEEDDVEDDEVQEDDAEEEDRSQDRDPCVNLREKTQEAKVSTSINHRH